MQVIYPGAPHEFDALFKETYRNGSPTYFRLSVATHSVPTRPKFGEAELLRLGDGVTVIAAGPQLQNAWEAAEELAGEGIRVEIIYLATLKPILDNAKKLIRESLSRTKKLVTVEEHSIIGGLGDAIALAAGEVRFRHLRLGIADKFLINYGSYAEHCEVNGLTKNCVMSAVQQIYSAKN